MLKVFIGMMSLKDSAHVVWLDSYKLANRLHMDQEVVLDALRVLSSPDTKRPGQPEEGRRIRAIEGGWFIINGEEYQKKIRLLQKRIRDRQAQANLRARRAGKPEPYPKRRMREITPREQEQLDQAHAQVCTAVKKLNEIQRGLTEAEQMKQDIIESGGQP